MGWAAGQGADQVGGGKTPPLGNPMSSHDAYMVANATPVSHQVIGSKPWYCIKVTNPL